MWVRFPLRPRSSKSYPGEVMQDSPGKIQEKASEACMSHEHMLVGSTPTPVKFFFGNC